MLLRPKKSIQTRSSPAEEGEMGEVASVEIEHADLL